MKRLMIKNKVKFERYTFMFSFLIIPTIGFLLFYVYVNFNSLFMAFQRPTYDGTGGVYFTLENFSKFFRQFSQEGEALLALKNTLMYYFTSLFVVLPLCVLMSYFIFKQISGFRFFRTVFYLPSIITGTAIAALYRYSLGVGGPYEALCGMLGVEYVYPMTQAPHANIFLVIYTIIFGLGGSLVVLGGAFNSVNREVLEAGELDGCNWFQELRLLILPMIWPTLSTIIILGTSGFLSSSGPLLVFTKGGYGTMTLSYMLYSYTAGELAGGSQDLYYASAIGLVMSAITIPIVFITRYYIYSRKEED